MDMSNIITSAETAVDIKETVTTNADLYGNRYTVHTLPDTDCRLPCPAVIAIPENSKHANVIMFSTCNKESTDMHERIRQSVEWLRTMASMSKDGPCTLCIAVLPSNGPDTRPYYQHISREAVEDGILDKCKEVLNKTKDLMRSENIKPDNKIILMGYGSSGIAAQRTALGLSFVNTDNIPIAVIAVNCVSAVPVPSVDLNWPLGIKNFKELTGMDFSFDVYQKIKQHYCVAHDFNKKFTTEEIQKYSNGDIYSMIDATLIDCSVDKETGKIYRKKYSDDINDRMIHVQKSLLETHDSLVEMTINGSKDIRCYCDDLNSDTGLSSETSAYLDALEYIDTGSCSQIRRQQKLDIYKHMILGKAQTQTGDQTVIFRDEENGITITAEIKIKQKED